MKKLGAILLTLCILTAFAAMPVAAVSPYEGYRYDQWNTALPMPNGYDAVLTLTAPQMGLEQAEEDGSTMVSLLKEPADLFYAADGCFYIVDSKSNCVFRMNEQLQHLNTLAEFRKADGTVTALNGPSGIFVEENGQMYIADTGNQRVLVCDAAGTVLAEITKPDSDIFPEGVEFAVSKVLKDNRGNLYVLVEGLYYGAAAFGRNYEFTGFFGANEVQLSASQLVKIAWRKIFPRSSLQYQSRYVPLELSNMALDSEGYVYTCTSTMNIQEKIRKLNASSINILSATSFGDKQSTYTTDGTYTDTRFVDLCVDEQGIINALDFSRGRVFQYDENGELLFVFGGTGNQVGLFQKPVAIETKGDRIYVLDQTKMAVTVFEPNQLAQNTHKAIDLYNKGLYEEALVPWEEVLRTDAGNAFAYASMGKAYLEAEDYEQAMRCFELGQDRAGYSKAYKEFRTRAIRGNFTPIGIGIILLSAVLIVYVKRRKLAPVLAKVGIRVSPVKVAKPLQGWRYIPYIMTHPGKGYEELKYNHGGRMSVAIPLVLAWFVILVIKYVAEGFIFNTNKEGQINVGIIFLETIFLFLVWVLSNWCLCTLFNGEGRMKQIFIYSAYALAPYLICQVVAIVLSNVLTADEGVFMEWLVIIGILWSAALLLCGMMTLHNYSGGQTVLSVLITVVGMVVIVFLMVLAVTLIQQIISFGVTIYRELNFRQYS